MALDIKPTDSLASMSRKVKAAHKQQKQEWHAKHDGYTGAPMEVAGKKLSSRERGLFNLHATRIAEQTPMSLNEIATRLANVMSGGATVEQAAKNVSAAIAAGGPGAMAGISAGAAGGGIVMNTTLPAGALAGKGATEIVKAIAAGMSTAGTPTTRSPLPGGRSGITKTPTTERTQNDTPHLATGASVCQECGADLSYDTDDAFDLYDTSGALVWYGCRGCVGRLGDHHRATVQIAHERDDLRKLLAEALLYLDDEHAEKVRVAAKRIAARETTDTSEVVAASDAKGLHVLDGVYEIERRHLVLEFLRTSAHDELVPILCETGKALASLFDGEIATFTLSYADSFSTGRRMAPQLVVTVSCWADDTRERLETFVRETWAQQPEAVRALVAICDK